MDIRIWEIQESFNAGRAQGFFGFPQVHLEMNLMKRHESIVKTPTMKYELKDQVH